MAEGSDMSLRVASDAEKARAGSPAQDRAAQKAHRARVRRLFWMTQARIWHWITGAATLIGMLLFAFTGITLNHAGQIEGKPAVIEREAIMPPEILAQLGDGLGEGKTANLPKPVADWLKQETGAPVSRRTGEWSETEVYVGMPKPGGDAWLSIDRETGDVVYEDTNRGAVSWLNDLHKGRNTGPVWFWFLDIFSVAAILFCITGLVLLWMHAPRRPPTWFIVGAGLLVPAVIAVFLVHV
ncbi:MAG TPA: PepSY-associated TM helix domain-containing protein [Hyphomonadaceae bacterium]|nr:PepSY-associated TM helix domain-containing protein [Hyphomonadaceae bacterium]